MSKLGSRRNVPHRVIDTWYYKVKDVEIERLDYVPEEDEADVPEAEKIKFTDKQTYRASKERVVNKTVTIELRVEKTTRQSEEPPHPLATIALELVCEELDYKMTGTDVEALRAAMWATLDKKFEITWESYYLVTLSHSRPYQGLGTGLVLSYDSIEKGTTWDGKSLLRQWHGSERKIKPWPGTFKDKNGDVIACIQATDANESALQEFCRRIDTMRERLQEFLLPENIQKTLLNLAGLTLLPPAAKTETKENNEEE